MKDKTKKILAGMTLGIMGALTLTGCSINQQQQNALNTIADNADKIVEMLNENLKYQNTKLSKEEAVEKIILARNILIMGDLDQLKCSSSINEYIGLFDKLNRSMDGTILYKSTGDTKVLATYTYNKVQDGEIIENANNKLVMVNKSDFVGNNHYVWYDGVKQSVDYTSNMWHLGDNMDPLAQIHISEITADDIYDIVIEDDVYTFKVVNSAFVDNRVFEIIAEIKIKDDKFIAMDTNFIEITCPEEIFTKDENGDIILDDKNMPVLPANYVGNEGVEVYVRSYSLTYEYENIDFSDVDEKVAEIESSN